MKSTKRSLLLTVMSMLLCVAMLLGTTYAWFTDSVSSAKNTIKAGNLDIEVLHQNAKITTAETIQDKTNLFTDADGNAMLWEPGAISYEIFTVENKGDLALKYSLALNITDYNALNAHTLKEVLKVKVLSGTNKLASITAETVKALDWTTTETLDVFKASGNLAVGASDVFQVVIYWEPTENDNRYNVNNGKKTSDNLDYLFIDFGINVVATQLNSEKDAFGPDYDKGIILPDLPVSINKTFQSEPIKNKEIGTETVTVKNVSTNEGVATMPKAAAVAVVDALTAAVSDKKADTDVSTVIYLKVETTEKTETAVTYQIDLSAVMTYTDTDNQTKTKELTNLNNNMAGKIITAEMNIGKGLSNVTVKHNTTPMAELTSAGQEAEGFYYDKASGFLTIKSKSFSPFTVDYTLDAPFAIGDNVYATIQEAVAAAQSGDTIKVIANCTSEGFVSFPADKFLTLDLNGYTVKTVGNSAGRWSEVLGTLTVVGDGYLGDDTHSATGYIFYVYGTLNLNASATFESGLEVAELRAAGALVNITDGYYIGDTYDNRVWTFNKLDSVATTSDFVVTGGTFDGFNPANANTEAPTQNWVADGYKVEEKDGVYSILPLKTDAEMIEEDADFVARIADNGYYSLKAALDAATEGCTIKVLKDTSFSTQINSVNAKNFVLDFGGHTVTGENQWTLASSGAVNATLKNGIYKQAGSQYGSSTSGRIGAADGSTVLFDGITFASTNTYCCTAVVIYAQNKTSADITNTYTFNECSFINAAVKFDGSSGSKNKFEILFDGCDFDATASANGMNLITVEDYNYGNITLKDTQMSFTNNPGGGGGYCLYIDTYLAYTDGNKTNVTLNNVSLAAAGKANPYGMRFMTYNSTYNDNATFTLTGTNVFTIGGNVVEPTIRESTATNKSLVWAENAAAYQACYTEWKAYASASPACASYNSMKYFLVECNGYYFVGGQGTQFNPPSSLEKTGIEVTKVIDNNGYAYKTIGTVDISTELGAADNADVHIYTLAN